MDCSMPDFPVHLYLPGLAQTHVQRVSDAMQPSHPVIPLSSCLISFPASRSFPVSQFFASGGQRIGASASVLPMYIQGWFPLGLIGSIFLLRVQGTLKSLLQQYSSKSTNSSVFSLLYGPTLTSIHDYQKSGNFDQTDLCWQSNVSSF